MGKQPQLPGSRAGRIADVHLTMLHAMLMPSSEGERHVTHSWAVSPRSHRLER